MASNGEEPVTKSYKEQTERAVPIITVRPVFTSRRTKVAVLVCIPTYENIMPETFKSVYGLKEPESQGRPLFDYVKGYGCAQARNKCAKEALEYKDKYNIEYLMFVDSDVILPEDALVHMTEGDADVVLGIYPRKNTTTGQTEIFLPAERDFTDKNNLNLANVPDEPRIAIKGGGMGCALIRVDLFERMEYPYFKYVEYEDGATLSEDNYFCWMAGKIGAKIECDTRVRCWHRSTQWVR